MTDRDPSFAAFEPAPLGPRRRRVDPALVGVLVVAVATVVAIVKPWSDPSTASSTATHRPIASATSAPTASPAAPTASVGTPATGTSTPPVAWSAVADVLSDHPTWGVRAIVSTMGSAGGPTSVLVDRWTAATRAAADAGDPGLPGGGRWVATSPAPDQSIVALGITFPPDSLPLDARVFRHGAAGWTEVDAPSLDPSVAAGAYLFAPPAVDGVRPGIWPTGAYRVEVLLAHSVMQIDVDLVDRFEVLHGPAVAPTSPSGELADPLRVDLAGMSGGGLFTVDDGQAVPRAASVTAPMTTAAAWRATAAIDDDGRAVVASLVAPTSNGLGFLYASGATKTDAELVRLLPAGTIPGARQVVGTRNTGNDAQPYVVFRAPDGAPWAPGIYRLSVDWTDATGRHGAAVHIDLRPGPDVTPSLVLAAMASFADIAGHERIAGLTSPEKARLDVTCPAAADLSVVTVPPRLIGIGHRAGIPVGAVRADLIVDDVRTVRQPLIVARDPAAGLLIVAPASGAPFAIGHYRITVREGDSARAIDICTGMTIGR